MPLSDKPTNNTSNSGANSAGTDITKAVNTPNQRSSSQIDIIIDQCKKWVNFRLQYIDPLNGCFRYAVNKKYREILQSREPNIWERNVTLKYWDPNNVWIAAAESVWNNELDWALSQLNTCLRRDEAKDKSKDNGNGIKPQEDERTIDIGGPFDRRLDRLFIDKDNESFIRIPYSTRYKESATSGLIVSEQYLNDSKYTMTDEQARRIADERQKLKNDDYYIGIPSLQNTYALTKLYGSEGGNKLVNKRGERRWYEVDQAIGENGTELPGYTTNPTTSSLISWGNGDPYGRTPYHFTDFVFSKYWNKIQNNRLITLRRFGAPILDNMKFPGMDGITKLGTPSNSDSSTNLGGATSGTSNGGSNSKVTFPPMASAITYFGGETGNSLREIMKFSSGLNWGEVKSNVWEVGTASTPDNEAGPGSLFKSLGSLSKMLNVAGGDFNPELIMNSGNLPPDPYSDGPYENRILGPVNRIDSVKKREAGLSFEWGGLDLAFEYVARPIGGVNTKAVLLDIISNFLIIGSASAVFFGGQHRFMGNPAKYPFLGGEKGIESWYSGKPLQWAENTIGSFVGQVNDPDGGIMSGASDFFNKLLGKGGGPGGLEGIFGAVKGLFTGKDGEVGGIGGNIIKNKLAEKTAGQVPYLTGLKALLTGEPVGEWHVTIGNPLNPIAMIGNLICTGIEVELGEELGPDDFPTEVKIKVKLDHGMPRDRDAIQSIFNRGMGRIYDLPDSFQGSADRESNTDQYSDTNNTQGATKRSKGWLAGPSTTGSRFGTPAIKSNKIAGGTTVWQRTSFAAVSPNENLSADGLLDMSRSAYRSIDWVALKSLK